MVAGIAEHNGWAVVVCVRVVAGVPEVVERRRVELIEPGLPLMPYEHDTRGLSAADAERLVEEVRESALRCAERALGRLGDVAVIALRKPPLARVPLSVAEVHASHHLLARADAMLYHEALRLAAEGLGMGVVTIQKGTERSLAAEVLGITGGHLDALLSGQRAALGPPWQQDHQAAMARAIGALSGG